MAPTPSLVLSSLSASSNLYFSIRSLRRRVVPLALTPRGPSNHLLVPRQNGGGQTDSTIGPIIPTQYDQQGGLQPGAVAGIVIGAVFGTLLFIGIIVWAMAANSGIEQPEDTHIEVRDRAVSPGRRRRRSRRESGYDVGEIRVVRDSSPRRSHRSPRHSGTRTQIVEERIVEERVPMRSRGPSPGPPPPPPMEQVYVERRPRRRSEDEEVIVIEGSDFSSVPPPRRKSKRKSGSGYR